MSNIEEALRRLSDSRLPNGNPVKGKLKHLVLNITNDGWQAIAQFWFTEKWTTSAGPNPVACIAEVLATGPQESSTSLDDLLV